MSENPAAPRGSVLSLLDWKEQLARLGQEPRSPAHHRHSRSSPSRRRVERVVAEGHGERAAAPPRVCSSQSLRRTRPRAHTVRERRGCRGGRDDARRTAWNRRPRSLVAARTRRSTGRLVAGLRQARRYGRPGRPHRPARPPPGRARGARGAGSRACNARPRSTARSEKPSRQPSKPGRPRKPAPVLEARRATITPAAVRPGDEKRRCQQRSASTRRARSASRALGPRGLP